MAITSTELKKQILASKISHVRSLNLEKALEYDLNSFFKSLKEKVIHELKEYWPDNEGVLLQGQLDLILAPIFESQQEYYNILREYNIKEYDSGYKQGRRLVNLARKPLSSFKSESNTIKVNKLANLKVDKDELFGTNDWTQQKLLDQSFTASENTMNRVDSDINKIISDGYKSGHGINKVAANIENRFQQLQTWESKRIARTEIHNAHQMGIMNIYQEMDVQYTQWTSAHDSRVRGHKPKDKANHVKMDGEIIPLGGTYSNGLQYPGDTKGPIHEWINCRCGNVPYIIPDGYIAPPGMAQFREKDLVQTLDYWNQDELIATATQEVGERQAQLYGIPIKESLMKNQFAIPTGDYSKFGINKRSLKTIQQIQKRNFGESREYAFCFDNKTGKILTDEIQGNSANVKIPKLNRKDYSSIHNHTDNSLSPPSPEDFYDHWLSKNETSAFHISRNETWAISVDTISKKKITRICDNIYDIEEKQILKMVKEHDTLKLKVKQGKMTQKELDEYLANKFIYKHNKECGDKILKYTSNIKGVKVKREFNKTTINPHKIKDLEDIKTINYNKKSKSIRKSPQIKGYDDYALTESENLKYEQLKAKNEKEGGLKFKERMDFEELADRKEFNEMRNKILREGGDPNDYFAQSVRYEKLYKKFKNWVPKGKVEIKAIKINKKELNTKDAFQLNPEEKKVYKQLKQNNAGLKEDERIYKSALEDKVTLNRYHKQLAEGKLDPIHNDEYVKLYNKHKKEWNLPELSTDLKFQIDKPSYHSDELYKSINKYGLTKNEVAEFEYLKKKELIGQKLSSKELKKIEFLESKDKFAYLNSVRTQGGGLNYEENLEFKKLYKQLKTKLKLDKSILKQEVTGYKSDIPLDKKAKDFKKFKGTTDDGLLPNGEKIEDYFTKDARDMNIREQEVAQRWLGSDYKAFTNFEVDCGRDVKKFEKWIYEKAKAYEKDSSLKYYEYYYQKCLNRTTGRINKSYAKELAKSIAHDVPVLDDILNNQTKKSMTLWRVQENHNLGDAKVGDIIEFPNFRSTAISKEGALWFSGTNSKPMSYIIEIEAPAGTKGAYLAPIKTGFFGGGGQGHAHPHFGENYAKEMEFLLKKCKVEVVKIGGRKVKGANGEMLTPIKLRVVGYK